jgi:outer membrane receptor protein involved in Fe transport
LIAADAFGPGLGLPSNLTSGNRGRVRNKGLELSADVRFTRHVSGYANYSWQARPESEDFDISLINLPPASRFNAGVSVDYAAYRPTTVNPPHLTIPNSPASLSPAGRTQSASVRITCSRRSAEALGRCGSPSTPCPCVARSL